MSVNNLSYEKMTWLTNQAIGGAVSAGGKHNKGEELGSQDLTFVPHPSLRDASVLRLLWLRLQVLAQDL